MILFLFVSIFLSISKSSFSSFTLPEKLIRCNQAISSDQINSINNNSQQLSLTLCDVSFNLSLRQNNHYLSKNFSIDLINDNSTSQYSSLASSSSLSLIGDVNQDPLSLVSLILTSDRLLSIFIYVNQTYYYYQTYGDDNETYYSLTFSLRDLIQHYSIQINDSIWSTLKQEEITYQKRTYSIRDLHFIFELLTSRCSLSTSTSTINTNSAFYCSLALICDTYLFRNVFQYDLTLTQEYLAYIIQQYNFILRTLTKHVYAGFLIQKLVIYNTTTIITANKSSNNNDSTTTTNFDMLHTLSASDWKKYCLVSLMTSSHNQTMSTIIGYPASIHTYDVGGTCSTPFESTENNITKKINLNTGITFISKHLLSSKNSTILFDLFIKTSYLYLRQMGLNLTLCSVNETKRRFFINKDVAPIIEKCSDLLSSTLKQSLKRRSHLCFTQVDDELFTQISKKQAYHQTCEETIDQQTIVHGKKTNRKQPYVENALNSDYRASFFEQNIVGLAVSLSLCLWIPVSCFVHFCIDEKNKKMHMSSHNVTMNNTNGLPSSLPSTKKSTKHRTIVFSELQPCLNSNSQCVSVQTQTE
ncbi:unnamed protein product [Didymodactylos carnosus]|uniref:Uncharacterized protein n=1 Tax=Didymodactylos carnosus TaxID=1234261 RepID=A0A813QIE3_9BILA|nr:unnamed protein product [Didymodactylos carnosus]CAF3548679.1 unnamed protein product [Didymodactylos carnosus]